MRTRMMFKFAKKLAGSLGLLALVAAPGDLRAETASFNAPALDRWMYPFDATGSGGRRGTASVFGAIGSANFDNRDAQFIVGFNTSSLVPTGRGAGSYLLQAVRFTAVDSAGGYTYDDTYDSIASYQAGATDDPGRPFELHGVGFRNGYNRLGLNAGDSDPPTFKEGSEFTNQAETVRTRSAYAMGFDASGNPRDVSNNITDGFESNPWAIGKTDQTPGAPVAVGSEGTVFTFDLNLSDPHVVSYLQNALDSGTLGLTVSGLLPSSQQSTGGIPQFINKENIAAGILNLSPKLEVTYTLVPEPSAMGRYR